MQKNRRSRPEAPHPPFENQMVPLPQQGRIKECERERTTVLAFFTFPRSFGIGKIEEKSPLATRSRRKLLRVGANDDFNQFLHSKS